MLTDWARRSFRWAVDPIARTLAALGLTPNGLTFLGLVLNIGAAYLLYLGEFFWGGLAVAFANAFDALDGALARQTGKVSTFGAFWDSTIDRYSEASLYFGLAAYFLRTAQSHLVLLAFAAAIGSLLVSYTRARAEGVGVECKEGLLTRVERTLLLVVFLLVQRIDIGLWVLVVLAHLTAWQRIYTVWRKTDNGRQPL
jgi:CDP-diacylglycerol--glycerol-3-phosphate 3-phosphatidyltransferase